MPESDAKLAVYTQNYKIIKTLSYFCIKMMPISNIILKFAFAINLFEISMNKNTHSLFNTSQSLRACLTMNVNSSMEHLLVKMSKFNPHIIQLINY